MTKPPLIDPYSWTIGNLSSNIDYVKKGVKPVASFVTNNLYLNECTEEIRKANLFYIISREGAFHTELSIYKNPHLEHVINFSLGRSYDKNIFTAWLNGKMFGYSEENIGEYIKGKTSKPKLPKPGKLR